MSCCCHSHPKEPAPSEAWGKYVCPMHPEVISDVAGDCPICGMPLEGVGPVPEDRREEKDLSLRLLIGAVLTLPVFLLAMSHLVPGNPFGHWAMSPAGLWLQALLATPVFWWAGWPFHRRAWASVKNRRANMFTLITLGTSAAWGFSIWETVRGGHHVYFEAAAMIVVLALIGQVLEARGRRSAGRAIRDLLDLAPRTALKLAGGATTEVPVESLVPGDRIRIRPGENLPVDGCIIEGRSDVGEASITGEPLPVLKEAGSDVWAGTTNGRGALIVEARRTGRETLLGQIVEIVTSAQQSRMPVQSKADRIAEWFVPAVLVTAGLTALVWAVAAPDFAIPNAIAVLIIACPCAIGLATPMSVTVAVGRAAQLGFLVREAGALEAAAGVDLVAFDKTGTLTEGRPEVVSIDVAAPFTKDEVLRLAAGLERLSEHPLAAAVLQAAGGLDLPSATRFESEPGAGIAGSVEGRHVLVGTPAFLEAREIELPAAMEGVLVAIDGKFAGSLRIDDPHRPAAAAVIQRLSELGLESVMLTGDAEPNAARVASAVGIVDWKSRLTPPAQAGAREAFKKYGHRVLVVGDGVNDAPAFAVADCSAAMGGGTDLAKQSAGFVLLGNRIESVASSIVLGRATVANIRQNLFFAFFYNILGIPVAAGLLYPLTGWLLSPVIAGAAMSLSSVTVIANALRLRSVKP